MNDEHTVSLQSSMQFLPTRLPLTVLQKVEEQFPSLREIMVSALCLVCRLKELCHLPLRICMAQRTKCFLWNICYLTFFVVTYFMDDFLYSYGLMYFVDLVALAWSFLAYW